LERLRSRIGPFLKPFRFGEIAVEAADGALAEGELVILPHSPSELLALSRNEARALVQSAVDMAAERGAEVIGLGGFSSIVARGGLALRAQAGVNLTSGNSFTAWAAMQAVEAASIRQGLVLADCTVAIVGAAGAIARALSMLCAERVAELILVGNPRAAETSLGKLTIVARDCKRHVASLAAAGRAFPPGSLADRWVRPQTSVPASDGDAGVTITTDIDQHLPRAHIVLTATNAVLPFIAAHHLRRDAVVCDVSRPFNIAIGLADERPDLRLVRGGLVQAPGGSALGLLEDRDRPNALMACAAETMILALSGYRSTRLCGRLDVATIEELGRLAQRLGFSFVN
jgi:predicted amino acid dehydrogenase